MPSSPSPQPELRRGISTLSALGINVIGMVGVGPFVTLPLIVVAMGGPQAMLGWLLGAALSLCDGMVWAELGTAYPEAGGSYAYLSHLYGEKKWGRLFSFLYAWQLLFSSPLSMASGCIGFAQYISFFVPSSSHAFLSTQLLGVPIILSGQTLIAMAAVLTALAVLYRSIVQIDKLVRWLGIAVVLTLLFITFAGFTHFHPQLAFDFPAGAFHLDQAFFIGLGAGLLVAVYDYGGYYSVCFLGGEVREPQRTIPRAVIGSILICATLYVLMNVSVLGVIPWREMLGERGLHERMFIMAVFIERLYGHTAASIMVLLIALAALCSIFALLLSQSRIPFAAARDGNFPRWFAALHPKHRIPQHALLALGGMTLLCCIFRLQEVISTLIVVRILFQFLLQGIAVMLPKHRQQRRLRGFRMPLYPLPALLAIAGFIFILISRPNFHREVRVAALILVAGASVYLVRQRRRA
ncbi:amino acid/polyamine/organocation transporter, APC superfamily [Bryocella elongata]|uniref:Amino acid/polyamine/organocation transporter, APC superfamily n=1 Tax=Bryocella elongata TaxID=863522 RepID=A0A1H6C1Q9_9BACT|nr:APC family permease [Bryocella elongata]SEG66296.1 amino acid/polyamine/organocation transporter, APC superfamily [Bryocella elongata]